MSDKLSKEISFLKKLRPRFDNDIEYVKYLMEILDDDIVSQEAVSSVISVDNTKCKTLKKGYPQHQTFSTNSRCADEPTSTERC